MKKMRLWVCTVYLWEVVNEKFYILFQVDLVGSGELSNIIKSVWNLYKRFTT